MPTPLVIAHRGASALETENSLAAFRRAVTLKADGIELDVHATADGGLVVHHDPSLGGRPIAEMTTAETTKHRLANGEAPPLLAEALVAASGLTVFVEVKALAPQYDTALIGTLERGPNPKHYHVHSFDHRIIRRLYDACQWIGYGVLSTSYPVDPTQQLRDSGAKTLWQEASMIDAPLVAMVHDAKAKLIAWTVDDPDRARALTALGADGLCTNTPDVIRKALA